LLIWIKAGVYTVIDFKSLHLYTKDLKVLYVEDDEFLQQNVLSMLKKLFSRVDIAANGKEGLEKYNQFLSDSGSYYDLVISDINMPYLNGIDMSRSILDINAEQYILIISAYNDTTNLQKLINIGINYFMPKPFDFQSLFIILEKISKAIIHKYEFDDNIKKLEVLNIELDSLVNGFDRYVIASRTDTRGIITYATTAYEHISGYTKEELIGSPHNIVRHPDMPKEIFADMWSTIKSGKIWVGEIKNLKKDGNFYWVKAKVEPYYDKNGVLLGYSAIREDITAKKEIEELNKNLEVKVKERTSEIENQLYCDSLTNLGSYQALSRDVENANFSFTTLILVNIDNFQNINGLYGFEEGNSVLEQFARCLEKFNKNNSYKLYRIYADEFILFKNCEFTCIEDYYRDLLNLRDSIKKYQFYISQIDATIELDTTIGISLGQEKPITTVDMAIRYAKKHKLWFQAYNTTLDLTTQLQDTIKWKQKIQNALDESKIIPVFQPIVNREQEIIKYEVLARLQEFEGGIEKLVSPEFFLEEAINAKLYNAIAKIVFDKTFKIMQKGDKDFSINISYEDIYNYTIIEIIEENLQKFPNIGNRLVIEILETQAIDNYQIMKEFISKFKEYGVRVAIDDFGMGHSNLSHILNINPDFIKIDGAFIKNINENKQSYAMVKAIIEFCKELNIKVVAEYVHSKEVFDTLYNLGIDEFQGFYFSKPLRIV